MFTFCCFGGETTWGETTWGRNDLGRNDLGAKRLGANRLGGETTCIHVNLALRDIIIQE